MPLGGLHQAPDRRRLRHHRSARAAPLPRALAAPLPDRPADRHRERGDLRDQGSDAGRRALRLHRQDRDLPRRCRLLRRRQGPFPDPQPAARPCATRPPGRSRRWGATTSTCSDPPGSTTAAGAAEPRSGCVIACSGVPRLDHRQQHPYRRTIVNRGRLALVVVIVALVAAFFALRPRPLLHARILQVAAGGDRRLLPRQPAADGRDLLR